MTFLSHMIAGSVAGIVEHFAIHPIDTVKTHLQAAPVQSGVAARTASIGSAFSAVIKADGFMGLYRGAGTVALGAGPAHALHFAVYEVVKEKLGGSGDGVHPIETATAGALATVFNDAIMTPADCIKQRLQMAGRCYSGAISGTAQIIREEGVIALFRSFPATVITNVPYVAVQFGVYETAKKMLARMGAEEEETLVVQLIAGGLGGGFASAITTPLDVVKTRLQLDGSGRYSNGVVPVLRQIAREEGAAALWRGLWPRVLVNAPSAAICWGTYETMKDLLGLKDEDASTGVIASATV
mmetsp:Transcript_19636/g.35402  ORF Transcript_19636/g.35402 Transcript_19636/m.35402 type:complete len:298 (-) Transcript_19636:173-1066(-)